jgi:hypothetical protein
MDRKLMPSFRGGLCLFCKYFPSPFEEETTRRGEERRPCLKGFYVKDLDPACEGWLPTLDLLCMYYAKGKISAEELARRLSHGEPLENILDGKPAPKTTPKPKILRKIKTQKTQTSLF